MGFVTPKKKKEVEPAPTAPGGAKPMPHADSPTLAAGSESWVASTHTLSEAEAHGHTITESEAAALKKNWRCKTDGQLNTGKRCTTCGTGRK